MTTLLPDSGVALTAVAMAQERRIESRRPDRLFDDPLAEAFVSAAGGSTAGTALSWLGEGRTLGDLVPAMTGFVALRTRYLDDRLLDAARAGIPQVVMLAAGLDTRAFRLTWPDGTRIFEIDLPEMITFKGRALSATTARPACRRTALPADLRGDWPTALASAGFDGDRPTAWLIEGLLMYLPEAAGERLLGQVTSLSAPGSRLIADHAYPAALHNDAFSAGRQTLAENRSSFGSTVADPHAWFARHRWKAEVAGPYDLSGAYGRPLPPVLDPALPAAPIFWLAQAELADRA